MTRGERAAQARSMFEAGASVNEVRRVCGGSGARVRALAAEAGYVVTDEEVSANARRLMVDAGRRGIAVARENGRRRAADRRASTVRRDDVTVCPTVYLVPLWSGRVHGAARAAMGR